MNAHPEVGELTRAYDSIWTFNGRTAYATPGESKILALAYYNPGSVLTFEMIVAAVWGSGTVADRRGSIKVRVSNIKAKLGCAHDQLLVPLTGVGYRVVCRTDRAALDFVAPIPWFGPIDQAARSWAFNGQAFYLTRTQWRIIVVLFEAQGRPVKWSNFTDCVGNRDVPGYVRQQVHILNQRFGWRRGQVIKSVRNTGYRMVTPAMPEPGLEGKQS